MPKVFLGLGSNIDRDRYLTAALDTLTDAFGELAVSPIYESAAIGFSGDHFLNLVVSFETSVALEDLAERLRTIEHAHGRPPGGPKFSPRTLDIDILLYGDCHGVFGALTLPRDEIGRYAFALRPLADLAPDARHPVNGRSYRQLWSEMAPTQGETLTRIPFRWRGREY